MSYDDEQLNRQFSFGVTHQEPSFESPYAHQDLSDEESPYSSNQPSPVQNQLYTPLVAVPSAIQLEMPPSGPQMLSNTGDILHAHQLLYTAPSGAHHDHHPAEIHHKAELDHDLLPNDHNHVHTHGEDVQHTSHTHSHQLAPQVHVRNPFIAKPTAPTPTPKLSMLKLLNTLPVLVAFSSLILSNGMIYTSSSESGEDPITSTALSALLGAFFLGAVKLIHRFNSGWQVEKNDHVYQHTLLMWAAISSGYLASTWLGASRATVVLFGLYLNQLNLYTLIAFLMDIYIAYNASPQSSVVRIALGYVIICISSRIVSKRLQKSRSLSFPVLTGCGLVSIFALGLSNLSDLSISIIGVNLASCVIFIVSLHYDSADLKTKFVAPLLSMLAAIFQYVILSKPINYLTLINILLPLLIQPSYSAELQEEKNAVEHESKSILKELLSHSDTRAIFNFLLLNSTFMFIQLLYSFRSKSLGLLSDSLHMALDCTSLALGLVAGILSKNEVDANGKFPFGLKNFEILAGFTNGTLLVGISGSIVFEAFGRLWNPVSLQKTNELIIVSILGLLVNLVGIFAFNHGHNHGHSHSHGPVEKEKHHDIHDGHSHAHSHMEHAPECSGMNDNMKGIFLHILADTLGSVGVVLSTLLTKFFHWDGFDPVASIIIAVLIFFSAIPLIKSTASTLLLQLNTSSEKRVRSVLTEVTHVKGVKSFTTPRFWPSSNNDVNGYLHVQVYRGENLSFIKSQCEALFAKSRIEVMIQMENDYDNCWCRDNSEIISAQ